MAKINWSELNLMEKPFLTEHEKIEAEKVHLSKHRLIVKAGNEEYSIYYMTTSTKHAKKDVLLLHGAHFSSETWIRLYTAQFLNAHGYNVFAINLPGYGMSQSETEVPMEDRGEFLRNLITNLKIDPCIIISPSFSGTFSIPLLKQHPETFVAFVAIAPSSTHLMTADEYDKLEVPTLIINGEKDTRFSNKDLIQIRTSKAEIIDKGRHACYKDNPNVFHQLLFNFLNVIA